MLFTAQSCNVDKPTSSADLCATAELGQFIFAKILHVADMNGHNEPSIEMIHRAGSDWAFDNNANRWTYGIYMYKAAHENHDPAAGELISRRMSGFKLGQTEHDAIFPKSDWREFRRTMSEAIARLREPAK